MPSEDIDEDDEFGDEDEADMHVPPESFYEYVGHFIEHADVPRRADFVVAGFYMPPV